MMPTGKQPGNEWKEQVRNALQNATQKQKIKKAIFCEFRPLERTKRPRKKLVMKFTNAEMA